MSGPSSAAAVSPSPPPMANPPPPHAAAPGLPRVAKVHVALEYIGFCTADDRREYQLQIRTAGVTHHYTVAIPHAAFGDGRARLQDGPDICYLRMQREMLTAGLEGPTELTISDDELIAYRTAHAPIPRGRAKTAAVAPAFAKEGRS
jgi:hypothetical protein